MIVLDTNVLSALMRPEAEVSVVDWLDNQPGLSIWTTSVTLIELSTGIEILPRGRRRDLLRQQLDRAFQFIIEDRVLPFNAAAAEAAALLIGARRRAGRPSELRDTMIAGIAIARRATLATRNIRHFADLPVAVVDPWTA
jgi:predicted nucleic acid-binding protein